MEFKSAIVCQSYFLVCHQLLITLKWTIVTHDHAANQFVVLLGLNTFISVI